MWLTRAIVVWIVATARSVACAAGDVGDLEPQVVASTACCAREDKPVRVDGVNADWLAAVNHRFNAYRQASDAEIWGREDYWATPASFSSRGAGDCEDFAIAKYFQLLQEGMPEYKLRLILALLYDSRRLAIGMHMVLAYYAAPDADPLVLDNFDPDIRPLSHRGDLAPRIAFNRIGWWTMDGTQPIAQVGPVPLPRWYELLERIETAARAGVQPQ